MPKYGLHKYGRFKYGKYKLSKGGGGGSQSLGPHVRYRIRTTTKDGERSDYLTMCKDRVSIPSSGPIKVRMRANGGEWIRTQNETVHADAVKVRIRSIESDGGMSEWIYGDRGNLS